MVSADPHAPERLDGYRHRMRTGRIARSLLPGAAAAIALVAVAAVIAPPTSVGSPHGHVLEPRATAPQAPLRAGESLVPAAMATTYTPRSTNKAADDYRCFIVDPKLASDAFLTGVRFTPGNRRTVHHVILFQLDADKVAGARAKDASERGPGWTCFGGPGIATTGTGAGGSALSAAPWLAAWAPGGDEHLIPDGLGVPMARGSQIVMQVHYNLRAGGGPDRTALELRTMPAEAGLTPLATRLLVAPVEVPCQPGQRGRLCDREAAVADVAARFGASSRSLVNGLRWYCQAQGGWSGPGTTSSCEWPVTQAGRIYAAAPHMHLLGASMRVTINPGTERERTVLDVPVYDFDRQGAQWLAEPVDVAQGDRVRITCSWDPRLRTMLPAFAGTKPRYVVWGEGTTDEMCLGILSVGRAPAAS